VLLERLAAGRGEAEKVDEAVPFLLADSEFTVAPHAFGR
jgi:hypothetical protein